MRTAGGRIRITGQLIDAETGKHIWAEKYDGELKDVFAVKDDIAEQVVAAVEPHLYVEEGFRAASKQPDSIDAWGLVVRALNLTSKLDRQQNDEAQTLLRRAIEMEPAYARAHALLGWTEWWAAWCYWNPDRRTIYRQTLERADQALSLDSADPWARMTAGLASSQLTQYDRALSELRTALHLNPSFALGRMVFGWALTRAGRFDEAVVESGRALRLSPLDNFSGLYNSIHGLTLLGARRFEEALPSLRASVADLRSMSGHYNSLISCCGHLGLTDEVQENLADRGLWGRHGLSVFARAYPRRLPIRRFCSKDAQGRRTPVSQGSRGMLTSCVASAPHGGRFTKLAADETEKWARSVRFTGAKVT